MRESAALSQLANCALGPWCAVDRSIVGAPSWSASHAVWALQFSSQLTHPPPASHPPHPSSLTVLHREHPQHGTAAPKPVKVLDGLVSLSIAARAVI